MSNNDNVRLEVAIEIMASKIADMTRKGYTVESDEIKQLLKEKNEMYKGNDKIIDKILEVYGKELKQSL